MKLPFLSLLSKKEKPEYFLALLLRDEKASAIIFESFSAKIKIFARSQEYFESTIEEATPEEFLAVLDKAISSAEAALPQGHEPQKTLFGVKENWVEGEKIKKEYLVKLKKASEALGLLPIGFLVIHEAIAHLLQKEEGVPVSAIFIEIDTKNVAVSVIRAGRILETKRSRVEDSLPKTIDRLLHHFANHEVLPSRIIVYDGKNSERLQQEFISHTWSKSLPFLHVPQVSVLKQGYDADAMLFGVATQMGFEVFLEKEAEQPVGGGEEKIELEEEEKEVKEESKESQAEDDLGFLKDQDIASLPLKSPKKSQLPKESKILEDKEPVIKEEKNNSLPQKALVFLPALNKLWEATLGFSPRIFRSLPSPKRRGKIIFVPPLVFLFAIFVLLFYIFGLSATIVVTMEPKTIEQDQDITFSQTTPTDFNTRTVRAEFISTSLEGTVTTPATGKKEVGEKAKGQVTLYSRFTQERTFSQGTVITASSGLEFTFDNAVTVASSSAGASAQPSTAKVSVTAKQIGKESNLPSGTKFTVSSFEPSLIEAKNESPFSGGTKKEVTVISREDANKLKEEIVSSLEAKAKEEIARQVDSERAVLPAFIGKSLTKQELSKDIGQESTSVELKGTVSYRGVSYVKKDLQDLLRQLLEKNLQDMLLGKKEIAYEVKDLKLKNDSQVTAAIQIKAFLIPKVDGKNLLGELAGKPFEDTEKILLNLPQVADVRISLRPGIPFLPKILPRNPSNIELVIKEE